MTTPVVPPMDSGNALLAGGPAQLAMSDVMTQAGKLAALTIRTASTTLTVFLSREDLQTWIDAEQAHADQMGGLTVIRAGSMAAMSAEPKTGVMG